jgi:hypothetical protein
MRGNQSPYALEKWLRENLKQMAGEYTVTLLLVLIFISLSETFRKDSAHEQKICRLPQVKSFGHRGKNIGG